MEDVKNKCECGVEIMPAALFCHRCGRKVPMSRSGQEIRAEMQKLEDLAKHTSVPTGMSAMTFRTALAWAVGDIPMSLTDLLTDMEKMNKAIAEAIKKVQEGGNAGPNS